MLAIRARGAMFWSECWCFTFRRRTFTRFLEKSIFAYFNVTICWTSSFSEKCAVSFIAHRKGILKIFVWFTRGTRISWAAGYRSTLCCVSEMAIPLVIKTGCSGFDYGSRSSRVRSPSEEQSSIYVYYCLPINSVAMSSPSTSSSIVSIWLSRNWTFVSSLCGITALLISSFVFS